MASRYEEQRLASIERWFAANDPELARSLAEGRPPRARAPRRGLVSVLVDLLGAALFFGGVVASSLPVITVGMALVVVAIGLHLIWLPDDS